MDTIEIIINIIMISLNAFCKIHSNSYQIHKRIRYFFLQKENERSPVWEAIGKTFH